MGAETCEKCGRPKDTGVGPNDGACFRESLGADDDCRIFAAEARADAAERERDDWKWRADQALQMQEKALAERDAAERRLAMKAVAVAREELEHAVSKLTTAEATIATLREEAAKARALLHRILDRAQLDGHKGIEQNAQAALAVFSPPQASTTTQGGEG